MDDHNVNPARREFIKRCVVGTCGLAWGVGTAWDLLLQGGDSGLRIGFHNDAPDALWKWSREADWYQPSAHSPRSLLHCTLCPHECLLGEGDRGFCRVRVAKGGKLFTVVYGNPCAVHLDPIEKKPLNHFLPGTPILSVATAGCNLRCKNCQNWEISQSKPEKTFNEDLPPQTLVAIARNRQIPSLAYTYSDPVIFFEYAKDTSRLAREQQIRNVLVTAGYIQESPLRELCRVTDAANVDIKAFNERFYKKVSGARLKPILRTLEVMREMGVWIEITRLIVPALSDDMNDIQRMCRWIKETLGPDIPLHLSRFYPSYQLSTLSPTPTRVLTHAYELARAEGLHYVYIGNIPGSETQATYCPRCHKAVIRREGYTILSNTLNKGSCPCGERIAGVWQS